MDKALAETIWELPPLILHPFNESGSPAALLENSKAALVLAGVMPADGTAPEELHRRALAGRYAEIRMLFYLGKDVMRWLEQCAEWASGAAAAADAPLVEQSFAHLLITDTPGGVRDKLRRWGVVDFRAVFSRAIGIQAVFGQPPTSENLAEEFLRHYHSYADAAFRCYMASEEHARITAASFRFELYASGEYSRLLESQWTQPE